MKHKQILKFIKAIRNSIIGAEFIYTNGSCYQFYLILKSIVPEAQAYYDSSHVITRIGDKFYDITGEVYCTDHLLVDKHYDHDDLRRLKFKIHIFNHQTIEKMKKTTTKKTKS